MYLREYFFISITSKHTNSRTYILSRSLKNFHVSYIERYKVCCLVKLGGKSSKLSYLMFSVSGYKLLVNIIPSFLRGWSSYGSRMICTTLFWIITSELIIYLHIWHIYTYLNLNIYIYIHILIY